MAITETRGVRGGDDPGPVVGLDPNDPDFRRDPYPTYARLRNECPVAHSDQFGGFWMLSRYHDVKDVARNPELFTSGQGVTLPPAGNPMPFLPIELDPPEHAKYRRALQAWFSVRAMEKLEPRIREIVIELIDEIAPRGEADLAQALAVPVPPIVIALLLGLPQQDWPRFCELGHDMVAAAEAEDQERGAVCAMELLTYLNAQIDDRRSNPADDMLTRMLSIEIDGEPIPSESVLALAFFLLMAGHETTIGGISLMLMHVAKTPGVKQRLLDDPTLVERAVEETLRFEPPVQSLARTVAHDVNVGGVDLTGGDRLVLSWASANRDSTVFADADQFVLDRARNPHVAFGDGIHRCLGASLARLQMRVVLEEVLNRIPNYAITDEAEIVIGGYLARHVTRLPVRW
jgi:cytochrome P450